MPETAPPEGVDASSVKVFPTILHVPARVIQAKPIIGGLVGLDASSANPAIQEPADGEGIVTDQLGLESKGRLFLKQVQRGTPLFVDSFSRDSPSFRLISAGDLYRNVMESKKTILRKTNG